MICVNTFTDGFLLIFWPEENAVTPLSVTSIIDPPKHELKIGVQCTVKDRTGFHEGKVAAVGKGVLYTP